VNPLGPLATPLALLYGLGVRGYRWSYESGLRSRHSFGIPVLCVGNIEAGGTGKSPLVATLCQKILDRGKRPAVVSRGYGRQDSRRNLFVSRGEGILASPGEGGDEPVLLARKVPGIPVVVARNRVEGIRMVQGDCDIVILDDGFQSLEVLPRAALVFLPSFLLHRAPKLSDMLPAGNLREPPETLSRASHWVLAVPQEAPGREIPDDQSVYSRLSGVLSRGLFRPILRQRFLLGDLRDESGQPAGRPDSLAGTRVALVLGIANPRRVVDHVRALGADIAGSLFLPDHAPFDRENRTRIREFARRMKAGGATLLLTTEKDQVKWTESPTGDLPVRVLSGRADLLSPGLWEDLFASLLPD